MRYRVLRTIGAVACMTAAGLLDSCGGSGSGTSTPPPDFVLSASPTTLTIEAGGTGSAVSVSAKPQNAFSGTVTVAITGLPMGVTAAPTSLSLAAGGSQSVTLTASSSASPTSATVTFTGSGGGLSHASTLGLTVQAAMLPPPSAPDITTFHDDSARDGLNAQETILTLSNVNSTQFGKVGFDATDGLVDAEPLYLANLNAGGSVRNMLFVATEHDSVYAFDADTGAQIWKTSVLGASETTSDGRSCSQVAPEIGITATPVIDRTMGPNGTIFVVAMSRDSGGTYHQRLHALDVTTGAEASGSPTEIAPTYPGTGVGSSNGNVLFDSKQYKERAALLLLNGNVYLAFSSHCDIEPYTGWVIAYNESTLQQTRVLNLTPNGSEGSVWMSGDGIAADGAGNLFLLDANGTFDVNVDANGFPVSADYGNAILKLSSTGQMAVTDYFEPFNTVAESNADLDIGSGGIVLLPDLIDAQEVTRHLLVGGGKDSNLYVADRDNLGKFNAGGTDNSNVYQELTSVGGIFSTPGFFNGVLYLGAVAKPLRAYPMSNAKLPSAPSSQTAISFAYPGTSPAISANGTSNGIVWALESNPSAAAVLHAYDATNLGHELYNSGTAGNRDAFGNGNKFITPLVVNGKVYVGTPTGVAVFGLL